MYMGIEVSTYRCAHRLAAIILYVGVFDRAWLKLLQEPTDAHRTIDPTYTKERVVQRVSNKLAIINQIGSGGYWF